MKKPGILASTARGIDNVMSEAYRGVALGASRKRATAANKNITDFLNKQTQHGTNLQDALGQQGSRWSEKKSTKNNINPVNVQNIVFETVIFDGTPAEKDKAKRQSEKNQALAQKMANELEKIAKNTKQQTKQDTKIKKKQGDFMAGAIVKSKTFSDKLKEIGNGVWDKFIDWFYKLQATKMFAGALKGVFGIGGKIMAGLGWGAKWLGKFMMAPAALASKMMGALVYGVKYSSGLATKVAKSIASLGVKGYETLKLAMQYSKNSFQNILEFGRQGLKNGWNFLKGGASSLWTKLKGLNTLPSKLWSKAGFLGKLGLVGISAAGVYLVAKALGVKDEDWVKAKDTVVDWFVNSDFAKRMKTWWEKINFTEIYDKFLSGVVNFWQIAKGSKAGPDGEKGIWSALKFAAGGTVILWRGLWGKSYEFMQALTGEKNPISYLTTKIFEYAAKGINNLGTFTRYIANEAWKNIQQKIVEVSPWLADKLGIDVGKVEAGDKLFVTPTGRTITQSQIDKLSRLATSYKDKIGRAKRAKRKGQKYVKLVKESIEISRKFFKIYGVQAFTIFGTVDRPRNERLNNEFVAFLSNYGKNRTSRTTYDVDGTLKRLDKERKENNNSIIKDKNKADKIIESTAKKVQAKLGSAEGVTKSSITKNLNKVTSVVSRKDAMTSKTLASELQGGKVPSNAKEFIALLDKLETGGNNRKYSTVNRKSGAFGRYQFMPRTWNGYAPKAGVYFVMSKQKALAGILPSASQQDAVYEVFFGSLISSLKKQGIQPTLLNLWVAHNLGPASPKFMVGRTNTPPISASKMLRNINANLPKNLQTGSLNTARLNYMKYYGQRIGKITGNTSWLSDIKNTGLIESIGDAASSVIDGVKSIINKSYLAYFGLRHFASNTSNSIDAAASKVDGTEGQGGGTFDGFSHADSCQIEGKSLKGLQRAAVEKLRKLCQVTGGKLFIVSAYRDPKYNSSVGGAKKSYHMRGMAIDIKWPGMNMSAKKAFLKKAIEVGFTGIGIYPSFIHVDIGPKRAWGSNGSRSTLPEWAAEIINNTVVSGETLTLDKDNASINTSGNSMFIPGVGMIPNGGPALQALQQQNIQMMDKINNVSSSLNQTTETQDAELFGQIPVAL